MVGFHGRCYRFSKRDRLQNIQDVQTVRGAGIWKEDLSLTADDPRREERSREPQLRRVPNLKKKPGPNA